MVRSSFLFCSYFPSCRPTILNWANFVSVRNGCFHPHHCLALCHSTGKFSSTELLIVNIKFSTKLVSSKCLQTFHQEKKQPTKDRKRKGTRKKRNGEKEKEKKRPAATSTSKSFQRNYLQFDWVQSSSEFRNNNCPWKIGHLHVITKHFPGAWLNNRELLLFERPQQIHFEGKYNLTSTTIFKRSARQWTFHEWICICVLCSSDFHPGKITGRKLIKRFSVTNCWRIDILFDRL